MDQLTPEWFAARCGCVTASRIADVMAKTKSGYSASRSNYMAELIAERLTGAPYERFQSPEMKWGVEKEPDARAAYEFLADVTVERVGFIKHASLAFCGASPDGQIGDEGLVEIKCPLTSTHISTLLSGTIDSKYIYQMQWQMACTRRLWCDFFSYDPRMPAHMQTFCKRVHRDDTQIAEIEHEVRQFLTEVAERVLTLNTKYPEVLAA